MRGDRAVETAAAGVRRARGDDATALGLAGFVMALVGHDRATAIEAFEAALALSPSCSTALTFRSVAMGWANESERAIEWGERAVQLSPFDRQIYAAFIGLAVGHFAQGNYEEALNASRRAVRPNPAFSVAHQVLTASLAAAGRAAEAKISRRHRSWNCLPISWSQRLTVLRALPDCRPRSQNRLPMLYTPRGLP